ncbi:hypothetical protein BO83DRAFT_4072 [Aspergillus eucalypticola CBS 122712]|uniref:Uncharacterized protein n=1 Tax=Aspergillus eucalypticola (strain CBS 122712 / IBT 29274) TaxID=1448314 RepID=A0A317WJP1_ASPEC|nr:uncharacterized protein BO83DRAFT_4072 [Aspergillus eucalypticola CBS 122712]PWY85288.1 hypothetical protein BO83DRAFT_4072 [Aspergillus eucalypticola CBS 122712]
MDSLVLNPPHTLSSRSATFSCTITGFSLCIKQTSKCSPIRGLVTFFFFFFCQPIFIGDETVLFRETNSERRPISPKNFSPAFSGLRISARGSPNLASFLLLLILFGGLVQRAVGPAIAMFSVASYTVRSVLGGSGSRWTDRSLTCQA